MELRLVLLALVLATSRGPALVDQTGHAFDLGSLRGEPVAVTFVSARCTDVCPLIDASFARAAQLLQTQRLPARLLTVTLDPRHDTPQTMRAIAQRFRANPRYWLIATGNADAVGAVLRRFHVVTVPDAHGVPKAHSTFVYVLDADGGLRRTMLASTSLDTDIVDAVRNLSQEPP